MKLKPMLLPLLSIILAGAVLLGASAGLRPVREAKAKAELDQKLKTLLPGGTAFAPEEYTGEDETVQRVYKAENGYVVETAAQGYAGKITMLVGVTNKGKVTGVTVRDLSETYGLGAEALSDVDFLSQFLGTAGEAEVGTTVDALTGATVTSKAVTRCVNSAVAFVTGADISSSATSWGE